MSGMPISWKVKPLLDAEGVTPYRLMVESSLSRAIVYGIANNTHEALDAGVMEKLIPAMRKLTNKPELQIGDVVEWVNKNG